MTSHPQGMLFVATNVASEDDADFNCWYDNEHVAERVAISGFISGTRYRARQAGRRYLGLYKTHSLDDFTRDDYYSAFTRQTAWSVTNLQRMIDPLRRVCRIDARTGAGSGAHLAVLTCAQPVTADDVMQVGEALSALPGFVTCARLSPDEVLSTPLPKEARLPGRLQQMVLIEASSEAAVDALARRASTALQGTAEFYTLSWQLTSQEMTS
ncbi:DUF4286 family protein [Erwinia persicina]|uniref:DUF4286 family protein n=1 Tax=Erwinia persicina TaxID=55211 RepID=UPI0017858E04|nr:DUF4286 family protein [Erwinia persicina]MBD8215714.1 hypothetical protein [Erwinia persicina]